VSGSVPPGDRFQGKAARLIERLQRENAELKAMVQMLRSRVERLEARNR
jgi:hypothetical protein